MSEGLIVSIALRKLGHPNVSPMDLEDMRQEATIALWKNANKFPADPKRSENYAFGAAIRETIKAYVRQIIGKNPYAEDLPTTLDGDIDLLNPEPPDEVEIAPEILEALAEIFIDARVQKRGRAKDAAMRDVAICAMIYAGYNNEAIANVLGLKNWRTAKAYRHKIRKVLAEYAKKNNIHLEV